MSRIEAALRRAGLADIDEGVEAHAGAAVQKLDDRWHRHEPRGDAEGAAESRPGHADSHDNVWLRSLPAAPTTADFDDKLVVASTADPVAIEEYRRLASSFHQMQFERGTKTVMVTSAMPGEGKSLTAANLALTLSESFQRQVLLIDADLRRPTIHNLFHLSNASGLMDALRSEHDRKLTLVGVSPHLTIVPAGPPDSDPMAGLISGRMRMILEQAAAKFDWVIVDTPPVGLLTDAKLLAEMAHAVVFVVGAGGVGCEVLKRAVQTIGRSKITGVVLNRVDQHQRPYNYYGYYGSRASR